MSTPENNEGLFIETVRKLWAACSDMESWKSGYTERLAKNLFFMQIQPDKFPGFIDSMAEAAFQNYVRRRTYLVVKGVIE